MGTVKNTQQLESFFIGNCKKVVAVFFTSRWFADELSSTTDNSSELCSLGDIRDELQKISESRADFVWIEVDIDSEDMHTLRSSWGIQSVPRIQLFKEPGFQKDQMPTNKVPEVVVPTRCPPWDKNEDSYDLVGTILSVLEELRSFVSDLPGLQGSKSPLKKPRLGTREGTRETPEILKTNSWDDLQKIYSAALDKANGAFGNGIDPISLVDDGVLVYHHRAGSNPLLSENYPVTFWYTIQGRTIKWKSVQQAYQAAKFDVDKVIKWIEEADSADEARKIANEYDRAPYHRSDFRKKNVSIMFDIVLAKFSQNKMLAKWLIDTDENSDKPAIFHTDEDPFWGLGPLNQDKKYTGKNMNGQVLMCVREVLKKMFAVQGGQKSFPQLSFRSLDKGQDDRQSMQDSFRRLGLGTGNDDALPLPNGTRIDCRYRVVDHRSTAGLGSFAGQFSYICTDEMPVAPSLEKRISTMLRRSIYCELQDALLKLQAALCKASDAKSAHELMEWVEVSDKMTKLKDALFKGRDPNEDWQELCDRLSVWKADIQSLCLRPLGDPQSELPDFRHLVDGIAFKLESLLTHRNETDHHRYVFVKTFALHSAKWSNIQHEITACSSKQPQLFHENICGISLAGFAAPVEIQHPGFGRIGLSARMPFVALENCDGCDLLEFYMCNVYAMSDCLEERMHGMGFGAAQGPEPAQSCAARVNMLLQAALDFQDVLFESMKKLKCALEVTDNNELLDGLFTLVDQALSNVAKESQGMPKGTLPSQKEKGGLVVPSLAWTEFKGMFLPDTNRHFRQFDSWQDFQNYLNDVIDAVAVPSEDSNGLSRLENLINDKKFHYTLPKKKEDALKAVEKELISTSLRKLNLDSLKHLSGLSKDDVMRWRPVLHAVWPHLKYLHASLAARYILELINAWDWRAAAKVLRDLKIGCFKTEDEDMGVPTDPVKLPEGSIESLRSAATKQHDAGLRFIITISTVLGDDALCMGPNFEAWPDELVNLLSEHVLASRRERLQWMCSCESADECPGNISRVIFLQAAKAIKKLHSHHRVHADIKLENFNITSAGQVKLLDFGFMLALGDSYPEELHTASYSSPQFKLLKLLYSDLQNNPIRFDAFSRRVRNQWHSIYYARKSDSENLRLFQDALENIKKHCGGKDTSMLNLKVVREVMKENDIWMLGSVLEKMAGYTSRTDPSYKQMKEIVSKIRSYVIVSVEQLIDTEWLKGSEETDHDQFRELLRPLFIRQPSTSGPYELNEAEPLFEADFGYVNIGDGCWRVFRVGDCVRDVNLGDEIIEIDGRKAPKLQTGDAKHKVDPGSERLGAFYSKMKLKIRMKDTVGQNDKHRTVILRRTRPAVKEPPKGDPDRFRDYLFGKKGLTNGTISRTELLKLFTRWWGSHGGALLFDQVLQNWHCRGWIEVKSNGEIGIDHQSMAPPPTDSAATTS